MSNVPKAREMLIGIARRLQARAVTAVDAGIEIENVVRRHMIREPAVRKTPPKNRPMSAAVRDEIKAIAATNPDLSEHQIAVIVGVNQGRVSETINGKHD